MSASDLSAAGYVMPEFAFAILLALAFTFGCAAIYAWREHAQQLTPILASVTTGLALLAGMMALADSGPVSLPAGSVKSGLHAERTRVRQSQLETRMTETRTGDPEPFEKKRKTGESADRIRLGENGLSQRQPTLNEQNAADHVQTTVKHSLKRGSQETETGEK